MPPPAGRGAAAGMGGGGGPGGGGGAPAPGMGGGGGAPDSGMGGGGGVSLPGIAGGGGGGAEGPVWAGAGDAGVEPVFMLDSGLGGAIVPNRIDARCFALPLPTRLSSSSSDEDSSSSLFDHSSSSFGAARVRAGAAAGSGRVVLAASIEPVFRWNGFVEALLSGLAGGDVTIAAAGVAGWAMLRKKGFLDPSAGGGLIVLPLGRAGSVGAFGVEIESRGGS